MTHYHRDIILVLKDDCSNPAFINTQMGYLNEVIASVDHKEGFCRAHELVDRNRITDNKKKILTAVKNEKLKPFRFLINKN